MRLYLVRGRVEYYVVFGLDFRSWSGWILGLGRIGFRSWSGWILGYGRVEYYVVVGLNLGRGRVGF